MKQLKLFTLTFVIWIVSGTISKVLFISLYHSSMGDVGIIDYLAVLWNGLALDAAVAGYLTIIPGLFLAISPWYNGRAIKWGWNCYFLVTGVMVSLAYVSNLGLYGYWGFPLDNTPLLYLKTSPSDAFASLSWVEWIVAPLSVTFSASLLYLLFSILYSRTCITKRRTRLCTASQKALVSIILLLSTVALLIPIRGGFSTGTNHTGTVYFSENIQLNHAAVNPVFSFIESVTHQEELGSKYRFMQDTDCDRIFASMTANALRCNAERHNYNVVLIGLESFSKYIMTESGYVKGVTPNLDNLSQEGIYFTNFYANSFRTDRGLVAILSGFPAQPTMSVMDIPHISTSLPSLASTLLRNGYDTHFYYGGDTNYSNMKSYIVGTGFNKVTSEDDFPKSQRMGKWGVPDEYIFGALFEDIRQSRPNKPFYKALMTSSSHEPFDVPYNSGLGEKLNAFAYTDHCLGDFIAKMKGLELWKNTLVVIVPDHLGAYPELMDNYQLWRYEIPLIITGGAIESHKKIDTIGSQIDICATVLGMLGIEHNDFIYSKDLLDSDIPHFAIFDFPDAMGIVDSTGYMIYDNTVGSIVSFAGTATDTLCRKAQAYIQKLYDDLEIRNNKSNKQKQ